VLHDDRDSDKPTTGRKEVSGKMSIDGMLGCICPDDVPAIEADRSDFSSLFFGCRQRDRQSSGAVIVVSLAVGGIWGYGLTKHATQKFCVRGDECFVEVRVDTAKIVSETGPSHMEADRNQL
jgi:hypothetical protein